MDRTVESPEAVGVDTARLERIKPAMQSYVDKRGFAGVSTLLARHGRVIHFEQVGWQDRESRTPLTADTIYRIYSMTKPIVCSAFMTLYEQGRFQLFDPVAKFIPGFAKARVLERANASNTREADLIRPIIIRDLLTHTSGLTYNFLEDSPVSELYRQARVGDPGRSLEAMRADTASSGLPARHTLALQRGNRRDRASDRDYLRPAAPRFPGQTYIRTVGHERNGLLGSSGETGSYCDDVWQPGYCDPYD